MYICQTCIGTSATLPGVNHSSDCISSDNTKVVKLSHFLIKIITRLDKLQTRVNALTRDQDEMAVKMMRTQPTKKRR